MPTLHSIDLIVRDVPRAVAFFRDVVGVTVVQQFERFAELEAQSVKLLLSPDALVPVAPVAGTILHFEETDLASAMARAQSFGSDIVSGPLKTDWGTESVLVQGPEGVLVDFFRWAPATPL
jgi:catechol 2,3-dioxygenase-like lactoylglutathione lyase family enzyme